MSFKHFYQTNRLRFLIIVLLSIMLPFVLIAASYMNMLEFTTLRNHNKRAWLLIILISLVAYLSSYFFGMAVEYLLAKQIKDFNNKLRSKLIRHFFNDKKEHPVAEIQNRMTNDLNAVNDQYFALIPTICNFIGYIIFTVAALLTINWTLLLVTVFSVAASLLLPKIIEQPIQKAMENVSLKNKQYLDITEKWISGIAELQRYIAGDKLLSVTHRSAKELEDAKLNLTAKQQLLSIITGSISQLMIFILFVWTGVLINKNFVPFGAVAVIGNFSAYLSSAIKYLPYYFGLIKGTKTLRQEITASTLPVETDSSLQQTPFSLRTSKLVVDFQNGESLRLPDFEINYGEKVLLTGDSGSGKSTLFKLILGILQPSEGTIEFKNQQGDVIIPDLAKIGYIAQEPTLFPSTVKNNITMFDEGLDSRLDTVVAEVGLQPDVAEFADGLEEQINLQKLNVSGGQRQKIILARSKIHDSNILLIDEGTSAIDQAATLEILAKLLELPSTIIFIAHNFDSRMTNLFERELHLHK